PRFDRPRPQELRAESVYRPDGSLLERLERILETLSLMHNESRRARFVQLLPQPDLQLARCFMGERDRHDPVHFGEPFRENTHDPRHQLGCFAGSGGRFNNQTLVERLTNDSPRLEIGPGCLLRRRHSVTSSGQVIDLHHYQSISWHVPQIRERIEPLRLLLPPALLLIWTANRAVIEQPPIVLRTPRPPECLRTR